MVHTGEGQVRKPSDLALVISGHPNGVSRVFGDYRGGADRPSLIQAQASYAELGAMKHRFTGLVRRPGATARSRHPERHSG
jgi:hypothetical protein